MRRKSILSRLHSAHLPAQMAVQQAAKLAEQVAHLALDRIDHARIRGRMLDGIANPFEELQESILGKIATL